MNQSVFQKAMNEIHSRRLHASAENERRFQEINTVIPELAEINFQMAQTASRILHGEKIDKIRQQNLQAQRYARQLLVTHGYPEDYLDMHYTCPYCQDTGYFQGRYCTCLEKEIASLSVETLNRNTQLQLRSFDQFSLEYYRGLTKSNTKGETVDCYAKMKKTLDYCIQYARNFTAHAPSLLLYGEVGVGKTHLSLSIVTEVLRQGYEVIYDSVGNLTSQIEQEHFNREKSDINTLKLLLDAELLVMDDLGTEFQTSFTDSVIYNLINTRLNRNLPTIISTNLTPGKLEEQYDERIMSRLCAVYQVWELMGEDIRMLKMKERRSSQYL